jgi:hypothetical protein
MKFSIKKRWVLSVILISGSLMSLSLSALATGGSSSVGGGSFTEIQLKEFRDELVTYFSATQVDQLFPEVRSWEEEHQQKFSDFISVISPVVVEYPVYGKFGELRDCSGKIKKNKNGDVVQRWFECSRNRIPENKLENQPLLYALIAHEIFVQAGLESSELPSVPSQYPMSSKFLDTHNLNLVTVSYQKYVPMKNKSEKKNPLEASITDYISNIKSSFFTENELNTMMKNEHVLGRAYTHDQTDPHLTRVSLHFYLNNGELEYFSMLDAIKSYYPSTRCEVVIGASSMDLGTNEESIALRELQNKTMRLNQNKTRTVIRDNVIKEIHLEFSNAEVGMNLSCYRSAYSPYPITLSSIQSNLGEYFILQ